MSAPGRAGAVGCAPGVHMRVMVAEGDWDGCAMGSRGLLCVNYFSRNMDNLLAGAAFGSAALGYYDKAYRLSGYPVSGFTSVVASVLHPYLSDRQGSPDEIYGRFVRLTQATFAVGIPASACMLAASREAVLVLFGPQWDASAPLLAALSVSVMFQMCTSLTGAFFQSLGDTRDMFLSAVANTAVTLAAICAGAASGDLLVLAVLVSAAWCVNPVATYHFLVARAFRRTLAGFARTMAPQLAVAGAMVALGAALRVMVGVGWWSRPTGLAPLALKLAVCCGAYGALLAVSGQWRHLAVLVGERRG